MTSFVEYRAQLWRIRSKIMVLTLFVGVLTLSACGSRGAQSVPEADLEATVAAMVDAKLTETASTESEEGQTESETPEAQEAVGDASTAPGPPALITPTPDRSGEIMDYLVLNTRHFKGDPDAPVVIIEFSDFQ
jgi:predicted small lipoprotein YifL